MDPCPHCGAELRAGASTCGACGAPIQEAAVRAATPTIEWSDSPGPSIEQRSGTEEAIAMGQVLAGRYRIVEHLGSGGMGQVYRAEDLMLGQPVALKFLGGALARDSEAVSRLAHEVRIARRISHPNVCRVYDIGEVDGRPFLSMEYVDGEDLGTLLRRIGHLPGDKAAELARQLCAGLQAAHDQEVLHRDLKPANVMIDGKGNARITDFGIASLRSEFRQGEAISGTPTYMAPELFTGGKPSIRSELYSLGLILYELFTGKPRFDAKSMTELLGQHRETMPPPADDEMDPRVADVLMACLESDPALRPDSAFAVLGRLPGGDPLAAALAAGETPSPELVACCGGKGCLRARTAVLGVAAIVIALALVLVLAPRVTLLGRVSMPKSEEVLADRAADVLQGLAYPMEDMYSAFGFEINKRLLVEIRDNDESLDRWERLGGPRPSAIDFWYRASPAPLLADRLGERVDWNDPPATAPGMAQVRLDPRGRLRQLLAVPRPADAGPSDTTPDWSPLFRAAGLDQERLEEAEPRDLPRVYADRRSAWSTGTARPASLRVEAASFGSRIVHFRVIEDESPEATTESTRLALLRSHLSTEEGNPGVLLDKFLELAVLIGGLVLAGLNLKKGRVDHANAFRISVAVCAMTFAWTSLRGVHSSSFMAELDLFVGALVVALFVGARFWVYYVAVEPHVRRIWPETLISWTRCVGGNHCDPLVGVSILAGLFLGLVSAVFFHVDRLTPGWVGRPPEVPFTDASFGLEAILGFGQQLGLLLASWVRALHFGLTFVLALVLLKMLTGSRWIAAVLYGGFVVVMWTLMGASTIFSWGLYALTLGCCLLALIRFGLFGLSVGAFAFFLVTTFPMTLDMSSWYVSGTLLAVGTILAMAVFAARVTTGSRSTSVRAS